MSNLADLSPEEWVKSSHSGNGGGSCLEWAPARAHSGTVPVRDSKHPDRPALTFPPQCWSSFVTGLKDGELPTT
ncbi:DUF397 domain-containing protein [Streptomyces sp. TRM 70361]|uniref:DUF397 domain-containing protein n=1 Tax=Streptomyces sp. TRM 70361 TaxID=3116553 RepID=UPI002E7C4277|nr:DUF397 domain-containing protein [Streptomyces sp. TRM 70361]MEE1939622.1 DUF397 domain-containing protein [Streptomyces sp. TRM 70361]